MQCTKCASIMKKVTRDYQVIDETVGVLDIPNAELWECPECERVLFPIQTARQISKTRQHRIHELIMCQPIGEFITAGDAASLLGHSKQAFSKNQRIKNGFIYSVEIDGRRFYLKSSVLAYNRTGDGRLSLLAHMQGEETYEVEASVGTQQTELLEEHSTAGERVPCEMTSLIQSKELAYVT